MNLNEIKKHWKKWADEFGTDLRATTKTTTIKKLEINAMYRAICKTGLPGRKAATVLEAGCGNGYNCFALARLLPGFSFTGIDYVPDMVENAKKIQNQHPAESSRITFLVGNVLELASNRNLASGYDIVFTDRCLINLNTLELQLEAFDQLAEKVVPGGYLIIVENIRQSYDRQNRCRESVGLPARVPAGFNLFLDEKAFLEHAGKTMKLISTDDFGSLHDIVLYVMVPMINGGRVDYEHPLVRAATELSIAISDDYESPFGEFGQNRLFLFQKQKETE